MYLTPDAELVRDWLLDITSTGGGDELDALATELAEKGYAEGLK